MGFSDASSRSGSGSTHLGVTAFFSVLHIRTLVLFLHPRTGDVDFASLVMALSAKFLHCKIMSFPFVIKK